MNILLRRSSALSLSNIRRNRNYCTSHLISECKFFLRGKSASKDINQFCQIHGYVPYIQILIRTNNSHNIPPSKKSLNSLRIIKITFSTFTIYFYYTQFRKHMEPLRIIAFQRFSPRTIFELALRDYLRLRTSPIYTRAASAAPPPRSPLPDYI